MANYYHPSGNFSIKSFIYFIFLCVTVFPILGLIYSYAIWYIPLIYINFIITGLFGLGIGLSVGLFVIKMGKVRSVPLAFIFTILGALIAMYLHWAAWVNLAVNVGEVLGNEKLGVAVSNIKMQEVVLLITKPDILFQNIKEINELGTWGLRGNTVSGIFLMVIWIIELLIIVIVALMFAIPRAKVPFCERNNKWFDEKQLGALNFIEDTVIFTEELERGNIANLETLSKVEDKKHESHSIFSLYSSEAGETYLSVENKLAKEDKKGKIEFKSDEFIEYLAIDKSLKEKLLSI